MRAAPHAGVLAGGMPANYLGANRLPGYPAAAAAANKVPARPSNLVAPYPPAAGPRAAAAAAQVPAYRRPGQPPRMDPAALPPAGGRPSFGVAARPGSRY